MGRNIHNDVENRTPNAGSSELAALPKRTLDGKVERRLGAHARSFGRLTARAVTRKRESTPTEIRSESARYCRLALPTPLAAGLWHGEQIQRSRTSSMQNGHRGSSQSAQYLLNSSEYHCRQPAHSSSIFKEIIRAQILDRREGTYAKKARDRSKTKLLRHRYDGRAADLCYGYSSYSSEP